MGYGKIKNSLKSGMGGSRNGRGRSEGTEIMKRYSRRLRREAAKRDIFQQLND